MCTTNRVVVVLGNFKHARVASVLWRRDGLDLLRCQYKVVRTEGLDAMNIHELRSYIRREFDMETTTKKLVIEAVTCTNREGQGICELHKVNGSVA